MTPPVSDDAPPEPTPPEPSKQKRKNRGREERQMVTVGPHLKNRLRALARAEGTTASDLTFKLITSGLAVHVAKKKSKTTHKPADGESTTHEPAATLSSVYDSWLSNNCDCCCCVKR